VASIQVVVHDANALTTWITVIGTLIGVVSVALIAAITANSRLAKQLRAELERHREQFAFDRGETDREEVRALIDALAEQLSLIAEAVKDANLTAHVLADDSYEEDGPVPHLALAEARQQLDQRTEGMIRRLQALRLRLGDESKDLVNLASKARNEAVAVSGELLVFDPHDPGLARFDRWVKELNRNVGGFMEAARRYTEARLAAFPSAFEPQREDPALDAGEIGPRHLAYRADEAYLKTWVRRRRALKRLPPEE
jgi:uncharacterized membrane-anchored protein YhcB (DUF1043 family)